MSIYIKLYENKIYLKNTKTYSENTIISDRPFSDNGLLIANIDEATMYLKIGIKQIMPMIYFLKPKIYLQPMKNINEITQAEQHAIIEAVYKAGARELIINENEVEVKKTINEF